jgi:hypothetical protein
MPRERAGGGHGEAPIARRGKCSICYKSVTQVPPGSEFRGQAGCKTTVQSITYHYDPSYETFPAPDRAANGDDLPSLVRTATLFGDPARRARDVLLCRRRDRPLEARPSWRVRVDAPGRAGVSIAMREPLHDDSPAAESAEARERAATGVRRRRRSRSIHVRNPPTEHKVNRNRRQCV